MDSHDRFYTKGEAYFAQPRPEMMRFVPAEAKRILDAGCGEGGFGSALKRERGAEVWGIEINPAAAKRAKKRLNRVIVADIQKGIARLPDGYFDCIVFNDVIEHLYDPYSMLAAMKQKLAPGGVFTASIPNVRHYYIMERYLVRGMWQYCDDGVLDRTHIRFFTLHSIREMFTSLGFDIVRIEGINPVKLFNFYFWNFITFGRLSDTKYQQFACVVKPKKDSNGA
ncbi:MAG: class I SAM-dependent methyltransferase [Spirochaetes bacterium]|nr:class I SAM-dependent methyltransferase [Spirochaetota bacterium]